MLLTNEYILLAAQLDQQAEEIEVQIEDVRVHLGKPAGVGEDDPPGLKKRRSAGRPSGIEMDPRPWSNLWTIRDGRIVRLEWFRDGDEALARLDGRD